jgi:predicted GIY-YIG superfamily endonuclease
MHYVYALELNWSRAYVGMSDQPWRRIKKHFEGRGSSWVKKYPPKRIISVEGPFQTVEDAKAAEYALLVELDEVFGRDRVRGAGRTAPYE